jgi:hypothetical protein
MGISQRWQMEGFFFHTERETTIPTAVATSTSTAIPTARKALNSTVLCIITSSSDSMSTSHGNNGSDGYNTDKNQGQHQV